MNLRDYQANAVAAVHEQTGDLFDPTKGESKSV